MCSRGWQYNDRVSWEALERTGGWPGLPKLIARVYEWGPQGGEQVLVSDLCGESLEWCLRRRRAAELTFSLVETCAIGVEVLRHLRHMHTAGFAHRDVSLANFLLPRRPPSKDTSRSQHAPQLYIIDFGLAERLPSSGRRQDASGTLRFSSVHVGLAPLGGRDDLMGLGFVLLACLAGALPWDADVNKPCVKKADIKAQHAAVLDAKRCLLREGVRTSFPSLEPRAQQLINDFFGLLEGVEPESEPPYEGIDAVLRKAGREATGRRAVFPPDDLFGLLPGK